MKALCLPDVIYDLIIENVTNAAAPDKPEGAWTPPPSEPLELSSENEIKTDTKAEDLARTNLASSVIKRDNAKELLSLDLVGNDNISSVNKNLLGLLQ